MSSPPTGPSPGEAVQRVRRRLRVAPKGAAVVALLMLVGLAWGLWYLAHRQFLASWAIRSAGGDVEWDLGDGRWRSGGVSYVRFGSTWQPATLADRDLKALTELAHLQSLEMYKCMSVTDLGLAGVLARLTELRELTISNRPRYSNDEPAWPLSDAWLSGLAPLTGLTKLEIMDIPITDAGLSRLAGLTNLEELDLSGTQITDASIPFLIANFPRLTSVALERTPMTPEGIHRLMAARPGLLIDHPAAMPEDPSAPQRP